MVEAMKVILKRSENGRWGLQKELSGLPGDIRRTASLIRKIFRKVADQLDATPARTARPVTLTPDVLTFTDRSSLKDNFLEAGWHHRSAAPARPENHENTSPSMYPRSGCARGFPVRLWDPRPLRHPG